MSEVRSAQQNVLGYTIERQQEREAGGTQRTRYEVRCPRTGAVLGRLDSLRMAKRFVLMHELRDVGARRKQERELRAMFAA